MGEHGYKLDWDKLKEEVRQSQEIFVLWREIDILRQSIPTPMTPMDSILSAILLIRVLPGEQLISLLTKLRDEVKAKVERKEGAIENEKLRLLFYGVPPLFNMGIFDQFEKYGVIFAKSMLEGVQGGIYDPSFIDPEKPLESLAFMSITDVINPTTQNMVEHMVNDVKNYHIDGVVCVVKRSCGLLPGFARQIKDGVYKETGVPTTIFDLDGLDTREYDDSTTKDHLDSFVETLLASKAA
jgi:benzoyl-CoA reductase/2-hydroxyglutaryl-CoA dehydratase subunit BcrC/BadD/HgdB